MQNKGLYKIDYSKIALKKDLPYQRGLIIHKSIHRLCFLPNPTIAFYLDNYVVVPIYASSVYLIVKSWAYEAL